MYEVKPLLDAFDANRDAPLITQISHRVECNENEITSNLYTWGPTVAGCVIDGEVRYKKCKTTTGTKVPAIEDTISLTKWKGTKTCLTAKDPELIMEVNDEGACPIVDNV